MLITGDNSSHSGCCAYKRASFIFMRPLLEGEVHLTADAYHLFCELSH